MKNTKKIVSLLLAAVTVCSLTLSSCVYTMLSPDMSGEAGYSQSQTATGDYPTRAEVAAMIAGATVSEGGSTINIEVENADRGSLVAAGKALLSAVSVQCKYTILTTAYTWGGGYRTYESEGASAGAGVIYRFDKDAGDAYILTNYHVVYQYNCNTENHISDDITVYLYGQENAQYAIPATFVGGSMNYDIAVLKVSDSAILRNSSARAADIADSNDVMVLESVVAIGNPEGTGISATVGTVNVDSEYIQIGMQTSQTTSQAISLRVMRIDAAVNSGNSGGGLFNGKGELIGIVNAKTSDTSIENMSYAIPSNIVTYIADNILYYCDGTDKESVYRCILGLAVESTAAWITVDEEGGIHRNEAIAVSEITPGGVAEEYFKLGDIVKSLRITDTVDGKPVTKTYEISRLFHVIDCLLNARVGSHLAFDIVRDGVEQTVEFDVPDGILVEY